MATWTRSKFNAEYVPGLFRVAVGSYKYGKERSLAGKICTMLKSTKEYEEIYFRSTLGKLVNIPEGNPITYDVAISGPTKRWTHTENGLGTKFTKNSIADNLYELDKSRYATAAMKDMGASASRYPDQILGLYFDNAAATTYKTAADGIAWASTSAHIRLDGSTYGNRQTLSSPTYTAIWTAIENAQNQYDDRQNRIECKVKRVICTVPMYKYLAEAIKSADRWDTANRARNILHDEYNIEIEQWSYFTASNAWALQLEGFDSGLIWFEREATSFAKEGDFETGDLKVKVWRRDSVEMGDPREFYWNI